MFLTCPASPQRGVWGWGISAPPASLWPGTPGRSSSALPHSAQETGSCHSITVNHSVYPVIQEDDLAYKTFRLDVPPILFNPWMGTYEELVWGWWWWWLWLLFDSYRLCSSPSWSRPECSSCSRSGGTCQRESALPSWGRSALSPSPW